MSPTAASLSADADRLAADAETLARAAGATFLGTTPQLAALLNRPLVLAGILRMKAARLALQERA